jgi:hypothetical protein
MGDGAASCRLLRTGVGDACVGFLGGRLFQIDKVISHTLERLELGDTSSIGKDASGLSAAEYVEKLAQALLASAIPDATGNIRLVSRGSGPLQVQSLAGSNKISVQASQRSARRTLQTYRGYVSEVRVSYTDAITGEAAQAVVAPQHQGGKVLSLDMGTLVGSITAARAIGEAMAYWFGPPAGVVTETWTDRTGGVAQDLDPVFWSTWQVGDLITFTTHTPSSTTPIDAWKLHQFKPRLEDRSIDVELLKLPIQLIPADL